MGGNAIKNASRITKSEYDRVCNILTDTLGRFYYVAIPPSYSNKESFGDIDIVVENNDLDINYILPLLNPTEIQKNSNVISFGYKYLNKIIQVDLIFVQHKEFETSLNYLSYNDLFNLLGRLARRVGLKLGHKGLEYIVRDKENNDRILGELLITSKLTEICQILDLDYNTYIAGFENKSDIFNFVIKSKYFDSYCFKLENLNHINRMRNKKRQIYTDFLEYVKDIPEKDEKIDRDLFVMNLLSEYHLTEDYYKIIMDEIKRRELALKFNGELVMKLTGLQGKELGAFMSAFKEKYNVVKLDKDMIEYFILMEYKHG